MQTHYNPIHNISIERLDSIERERERTMSTKEFQEWMQDLHIGRLVPKNKEGMQRAERMMNEWIKKEEQEMLHWPEFIRRWF